jgi:hypothetical protein
MWSEWILRNVAIIWSRRSSTPRLIAVLKVWSQGWLRSAKGEGSIRTNEDK